MSTGNSPPGTKIARDALDKLPYVTLVPYDGRVVPLLPFFEPQKKDWHLYVPYGDQELIRLAGGETISGSYLSVTKAAPDSDIDFPLGTLVIQHLSFPETLIALQKLESDLHRCAAILAKYHLLWQQRRDWRGDAPLLVESELEYLLLLLRSFYDLLQEIIRTACNRFVSDRDRSQKLTSPLPHSFAKIAMSGHEIAEPYDLVKRYQMPEPLARWYHLEAPFFRELRELRDGIAHHGRQISTVFEIDWGFALNPSDSPWKRFDEWPLDKRWNARLGSLRTVFSGFVERALQTTTRLASTIAETLQLPPAIADGLRLFVRSPFGHYLVRLEAMRTQPWEGKDGHLSTAG